MIASGTMVEAANREDWLESRRGGIGASEAADACGCGHGTRLGLYMRKLGMAPQVEANQAMRWGTRLEPQIAAAYSEETGYGFLAEQLFVRSEEHPFLFATLDRVRSDGRIVELKNVGARSAHLWGESGTDEIPPDKLIQVLHQMIVMPADIADVAALIGGQDFRIYTISRDAAACRRIIELEAEFWGYVERREPPPIDPGRDGRNLVHLWPDAEGEIELGEEETHRIDGWEQAKLDVLTAEQERDRLRALILADLRDAGAARLADGRLLTRKVIEVGEQTIVRKGYSFIDLRFRKRRGDG